MKETEMKENVLSVALRKVRENMVKGLREDLAETVREMDAERARVGDWDSPYWCYLRDKERRLERCLRENELELLEN